MPVISLLGIITKEFFYGNAGSLERIFFFAAGSRGHDKMTQRENLAKILPGADLAEGVQSDDKIKLVTRPLMRKGADRIDGIGNSRARDFHGGDGEARIARHCKPDHFQSILR